MRRITSSLLVRAALIITVFAAGTSAQNGGNTPPLAKRVPHLTEIHGYTLKDDYFWLREKKNPEVIKYLEEENAYADEAMKPTKEMQ